MLSEVKEILDLETKLEWREMLEKYFQRKFVGNSSRRSRGIDRCINLNEIALAVWFWADLQLWRCKREGRKGCGTGEGNEIWQRGVDKRPEFGQLGKAWAEDGSGELLVRGSGDFFQLFL
jgi:hypothetical protein